MVFRQVIHPDLGCTSYVIASGAGYDSVEKLR